MQPSSTKTGTSHWENGAYLRYDYHFLQSFCIERPGKSGDGFVTLYICSFVLDQVVNSARQSVQFFIISNKYEEIGHRIKKDLHRGVTFIDGVGCYTQNNVKMMFVLAKKRESSTIFRLIKDIDPKAFVSQSAVIGVFGEGFDRIKVK